MLLAHAPVVFLLRHIATLHTTSHALVQPLKRINRHGRRTCPASAAHARSAHAPRLPLVLIVEHHAIRPPPPIKLRRRRVVPSPPASKPPGDVAIVDAKPNRRARAAAAFACFLNLRFLLCHAGHLRRRRRSLSRRGSRSWRAAACATRSRTVVTTACQPALHAPGAQRPGYSASRCRDLCWSGLAG
jgi:hypothetical protein